MPARTKACAICRKKRIKCDATLPECLMCLRTGRKCPGLPDGPLIVDMTKSAKDGMKKRRSRSPKCSEGKDISTALQPLDKAWISIPQVSHGAVVGEAFYENFLLFFASGADKKRPERRITWLHRLPLLSTNGSNAALVHALRATSYAYCGYLDSNAEVLRYSYELYGEALKMHRSLLHKSKTVDLRMISTSVMLSVFEAIQATSADAYRQHVIGAAKLIQSVGEGQCGQGILCQLFWHIRSQMAFINLTTKDPEHSLPSGKWGVEVDLERVITGPPLFQRLMGHITTLSEMYRNKNPSDSAFESLSSSDIDPYTLIRTEIDLLWYEFTSMSESEYFLGPSFAWKDPLLGQTHYSDPFTGLTLAYFHATWILDRLLNPEQLKPIHLFSLDESCAAILDILAYIDTQNIGCAYLRMATPLYLVARHASNEVHRQEAARIFGSWMKSNNMRGLSSLALESLNHGHVDIGGELEEIFDADGDGKSTLLVKEEAHAPSFER